MWTSVEGQITELCRDLAIEVKRVRQLEMQADELRLAFESGSATPSGAPHGDITQQ
jgi:hypothetical protein